MIKVADLKNKRAVIVGATGSIGSAIARRLAEEKIDLVLLSTSRNRLDNLINELSCFSVNIQGKECDLSDIDSFDSLVETDPAFRSVDILVNSAGVFPNKPISEVSLADFQSIMNINLNSAYLMCSRLSPDMIDKKWGRIVNIGSSSCYGGYKNTTAYCVSKHGLLGLSRSLHDELKEYGVRVYNVSPSSTQGRMGKTTIGQDYSTFLDPEEVADYVMFAIKHDGNAMCEEVLIKRMQLR